MDWDDGCLFLSSSSLFARGQLLVVSRWARKVSQVHMVAWKISSFGGLLGLTTSHYTG